MLMALLLGWLLSGRGDGLWFFNGATPSEMRKAVAKIAPDKGLRKAVEATLDQIASEARRLHSERARVEADTLAALENHETTAEQFQALAVQVDELNATANRNLLDLRFALRRQLSDAQWCALLVPSTSQP
jgi:hypothetical protein